MWLILGCVFLTKHYATMTYAVLLFMSGSWDSVSTHHEEIYEQISDPQKNMWCEAS